MTAAARLTATPRTTKVVPIQRETPCASEEAFPAPPPTPAEITRPGNDEPEPHHRQTCAHPGQQRPLGGEVDPWVGGIVVAFFVDPFVLPHWFVNCVERYAPVHSRSRKVLIPAITPERHQQGGVPLPASGNIGWILEYHRERSGGDSGRPAQSRSSRPRRISVSQADLQRRDCQERSAASFPGPSTRETGNRSVLWAAAREFLDGKLHQSVDVLIEHSLEVLCIGGVAKPKGVRENLPHDVPWFDELVLAATGFRYRPPTGSSLMWFVVAKKCLIACLHFLQNCWLQ